jgi:hypothetical protein
MTTINQLKRISILTRRAKLRSVITRLNANIERWTERRHLQPVISDEHYGKLLEELGDRVTAAMIELEELEQA